MPRDDILTKRSWPIQWTLPLLICGLLAATVGLGSWSAYREVRRSATAAATDRLDRVARQLVGLLSTSARQLDSVGRDLAEDTAVNAYLRSGSPADRARAIAALARRRPQSATNPPAFELWDRDGGRRLVSAQNLPPIDTGFARQLTLAARAQRGSFISPLRMIGDTVFYAVVTAVREGENRVGHVVQRRRMSGNPEGARRLADLVGTNATLLFGNARGDVWTDLAARTEGPPSGTIDTSRVVRYERPGSGPRFARALTIPNTPWMVAVEFPEAVVLEQVGGFVWRTALAAAGILLVAAFGAWMVSRRLTAPLSELSAAAQAISDGDYGRRVSVHRGDEIGRVAESFNRMAQEVGRSQEALEARVADRTRALVDSEDRFRLLFDRAPHPTWVFDLETLAFLAVNDSAVRVYGYTREEFLGMTIRDIRPVEDIPKLLERLTTASSPRELSIWRHRTKDGTLLDVEISSHKLSFGGRPAELVLAQDVTERQRDEAALRASEERFRTLADTAPDAIVTADAHGVITFFSRSAERLFGYPADEAVGRPLTLLMPERFHAAHTAGLARYLGTGEARVVGRTVELAGRRRDGTEFPLELSLSAAATGSAVTFTGIIRDVTERKQAEETLQAANRELEAFSYSVSHDLRAPLRAIGGFSRLLLDDHGAKLAADGRRMLDVISENTRRMGELIDDLLAFSRLGRKPLAVAPVDMTALVRSVVSETVAHHQGPKPEVSVSDLPPATGDVAMLRQVWVNLLSNALKFSRTREAPRLEIGANGGATPAYYVKDNGVGFDMRFADKLFGVFQRLHRQEEFDGTGVGLAIVQRIIQRHGGRVWAEAAPDAGATFFFTLPTAGA